MSKFSIAENIKLLIFDCDGTLVNTLNAHYAAWKEAFHQINKKFFTKAEFEEKIFGISNVESVAIINKYFNYDVDPIEITWLKSKIFLAKHLNKVESIDKIIKIVHQYHGILPMVVASGGQPDEVDILLESAGIKDLFADVVTVGDVKHGKPNPDVFLEVSRRMGIEPAACLVFEDSQPGFEAAKRAGMPFVDINTF